MKIFSVTDPEFKAYGRVVTGLDAAKAEILEALAKTPQPAEGTGYVPEDERLQELPAAVVRRVLQNATPQTRAIINQFLKVSACLTGSFELR